MSAFMIDRKDYLAFAVQLHRFCNAPMPPHYTLELLRTLASRYDQYLDVANRQAGTVDDARQPPCSLASLSAGASAGA